jgi:hypothetical protein
VFCDNHLYSTVILTKEESHPDGSSTVFCDNHLYSTVILTKEESLIIFSYIF